MKLRCDLPILSIAVYMQHHLSILPLSLAGSLSHILKAGYFKSCTINQTIVSKIIHYYQEQNPQGNLVACQGMYY
jgi:hypothetical protein